MNQKQTGAPLAPVRTRFNIVRGCLEDVYAVAGRGGVVISTGFPTFLLRVTK